MSNYRFIISVTNMENKILFIVLMVPFSTNTSALVITRTKSQTITVLPSNEAVGSCCIADRSILLAPGGPGPK